MKKILIAISVLIPVVAFAEVPVEVGDFAVYSRVYYPRSGQSPKKSQTIRTVESVEYNGDVFVSIQKKVPGKPVQKLFKKPHRAQFSSPILDIQKFCKQWKGRLGELTVRGKTYSACKTVSGRWGRVFKRWFVEGIPFGMLRSITYHRKGKKKVSVTELVDFGGFGLSSP